MKKLFVFFSLLPVLAYGQFDLQLELLAEGYTNPCEIVNAGDERLFVVEQVGRIRILYTDGTKETEPFLDIASQVSSGGEKGLLGLAFPPNYCITGRFYVNYTFSESGQLKTRISRFTVNPDNRNDALEQSEQVLIEFDQPFSNHNGGQLEFGPDGYLYIGTGDGGSGGDPQNNAQNTSRWLGKLLRIDVSENEYTIPDDNPFASDESALHEIWAYGLRNPWKFAFDELTGDLYIGDVGQNAIEEVDFLSAGTPGGSNFGWRCYEGSSEYDLTQCGGISNFVDPVFEYSHASNGRCSLTGGRVYRGKSFNNIQGKYILTDLCSGEYWLLWQENGEWNNYNGGILSGGLVAFGSDVWGELYTARNGNGKIYRVLESSGILLDHISFLDYNTLISNLQGSSYFWYLNGVLIEEENGPTLDFTENGDYTVTIINQSGCEIKSNAVSVVTAGVEDYIGIANFDVYPNPVNELLHITLHPEQLSGQNLYFELYASDGKKMKQENIHINQTDLSIDVSTLKKGMYFIFCRNEYGEVLGSRKVVLL